MKANFYLKIDAKSLLLSVNANYLKKLNVHLAHPSQTLYQTNNKPQKKFDY